jgi:nicotinamide-nucleotide amidase
MAQGALDRSSADVALAVTGFAGPSGDGCEEGLVHLAAATRDGPTSHRVEHFGSAGRGPVRILALRAMLEMLEEAIRD